MGRGWIAAELITRQSLGRYHRATHGHASWMGTQGGQKERTKGKFRKNIYKKKIRKKEMIALLGILVVNSRLFWRGKWDTYGQACTQERCSSSPSEREANPSRNGPNSH